MHLIPRSDVLAEKDELYRQWRLGQLSTDEYKAAFAAADAAHSHDQLCVNGDHRIAIVILKGRALCAVCAQKHTQGRA